MVQKQTKMLTELSGQMQIFRWLWAGLTHGVTNVELCAAYAAIANNGNYIEPIYYTKILDHNGNVLIEKNSAGRSVIKESTAWLLTSAMEDVVNQGTGTACQACGYDSCR